MFSQNEIIEMAKQAGLTLTYIGDPVGLSYAQIAHFAKLVAAKEREECAVICENYADVDTYPDGIIHDYHSHLIRLRGKE
jgi:hypothetical protein